MAEVIDIEEHTAMVPCVGDVLYRRHATIDAEVMLAAGWVLVVESNFGGVNRKRWTRAGLSVTGVSCYSYSTVRLVRNV
jgi:hypothetical protein